MCAPKRVIQQLCIKDGVSERANGNEGSFIAKGMVAVQMMSNGDVAL